MADLILLGNTVSSTNSAFDAMIDAVSQLEGRWLHRHELWLLSCYINLDLIEELIERLSEEIKLREVNFMFDRAELFRIGPKKVKNKLESIEKWCKSFDPSVEFNYQQISGPIGEMVHAKGYAVFQRIEGQARPGFVMVTSGNLTRRGFTGGGNIELAYLSHRVGDIEQFERLYNDMWEKNGKNISLDIAEEEMALFKYALLSSGRFLHKWDRTLSSLIGVRYSLTKSAKERIAIKDPDLIELGFELEKDTITKQYLNISNLPPKELPGNFIRNSTIETLLGRWCPQSIWAISEEQGKEEAEKYFKSFKDATTPDKLAVALKEAKKVQEILLDKQLVTVNKGHLTRWEDRIKHLRENQEQIRRLSVGYEDFDLPYNYSDSNETRELYESLVDSIDLSRRANLAIRKISEAIEMMSLQYLDLSNEENEGVKKTLVG